jgi:hypothetical protein
MLQASFCFSLSIPQKGFSDKASLRIAALSNLHYSGVDNDRESLSPSFTSKLTPHIITRDPEYCLS